MARWRCGTGNAGDGDGSASGGGAVRGNGVAHHSVRSGGVASARPHGSDRGVTFRGVALLRAPGCGQPRRQRRRRGAREWGGASQRAQRRGGLSAAARHAHGPTASIAAQELWGSGSGG